MPAPRHAGDGDEHAEREAHVDVLQVVLARAAIVIASPLPRAARRRHLDARAAGEVRARERLAVLLDRVGRALGDDASAELAGAGTEVDDPVGRAHRLFVVLDDEHGVAEIAQAPQRAR